MKDTRYRLSRLQLILVYAASLLLGILTLTGCTSAGWAQGLQALSHDNATQSFEYSGVYGPIKWYRLNPLPGQIVTRSADGAITVGWATNPPLTTITITNAAVTPTK